jgi:phosphogluconate dehydratase
MRELIENGLLINDVTTILGHGLIAHAREPFLTDAGLEWRDPPAVSGNLDILRPVSAPFSAEGGLKLLKGNLGRCVIKVSAVDPANRIVEAPARVFDNQESVTAAFRAGELDRDVVVVVRFQGPKANGMPELHGLTPAMSVLQKRGHRVALVTDGRMSGASGTVPAAIHMTPEVMNGGPLGRVRDGDVIRLDSEAGTLQCMVNEAEWQQRVIPEPDLSANEWGMGRELFTGFRARASDAEAGAYSCL